MTRAKAQGNDSIGSFATPQGDGSTDEDEPSL